MTAVVNEIVNFFSPKAFDNADNCEIEQGPELDISKIHASGGFLGIFIEDHWQWKQVFCLKVCSGWTYGMI
jgi:hypothetical protein